MLIPQVHIIQKQSPKEISASFNSWAEKRALEVKKLGAKAVEDSLGIPSETHLQWDQGLQHYIMTVVYLATQAEILKSRKQ